MERSENINELATALAKAQGKIKLAVKNANNPFFKRQYADMASVKEACQQALSENGIAVVQIPGSNGQSIEIETVLMHSSGQWISGKLPSDAKDRLPQTIGTAITYLCRYALKAMVGVAAEGEDDDGNAASGSTEKKGKPEVRPSTLKQTPAAPGNVRFEK